MTADAERKAGHPRQIGIGIVKLIAAADCEERRIVVLAAELKAM